MVMGEGGLKAYLGTYDSKEVEKQIIQGNTYAIEVYKAMAYQIAKEIGAMATVLNDKIALIVITGGLAHSNQLITWIKERITFLAPIMILAGEFEMEALAFGALNVLEGKEKAKIY